MIVTIDAAIIIPTRFKIIYCSSEYDISIIIFEMSNYITELALKLLAFKLLWTPLYVSHWLLYIYKLY